MTFLTRLLVLLFLSTSVTTINAAETLYVTDVLQLKVYSGKGSGKSLETITSGEKLQVLDSEVYYKKVKTESGVTGWVKSAYLVDKEPARFLLAQLENEKRQLQTRIGEMEIALAEPESRLQQERNKMAVEQQSLNEKLNVAEDRITELSSDLEKTQSELRFYKPGGVIDPRVWFTLIGLMLFITGIILGVVIVDNRQRKRLYGFRLKT